MSSYMNRLPTSWVIPSPEPKPEAPKNPPKASKPATRRSKAPKADKKPT